MVFRPQALEASWRPFTADSPWARRLPAGRQEVPIPPAAMATAPMGVSDGDYGIRFYPAAASDPLWTIQFGGYNNGAGSYQSGGSLQIRAPAGMRQPAGSDRTVMVVDENRRYAYEMWHFWRVASGRGWADYIVRVDLATNGIREGITGSGLPGIGGLLRHAELAAPGPIQHKLWAAAHPDIVYARAVWPALRHDASGDGRLAFLNYGDVVALGLAYNFQQNPCGLSPFMQRLARALQDYGAIVQDKGGDSLGFPAEVNAVRDNIDIDYDVTMWHQFACLKPYMVKVLNPWQ